MEGLHYLSDLTDEQWQIIRPRLPPPSRRGAPRCVDRRRDFRDQLRLNNDGGDAR